MQHSCLNTCGNGGYIPPNLALRRPAPVEETEKTEVPLVSSSTGPLLHRGRRTLPWIRHRGLAGVMWNATSTETIGKQPAQTALGRGSATCQRTMPPPWTINTAPATPPHARCWRTSFRNIPHSTGRSKHRRSICKRPISQLQSNLLMGWEDLGPGEQQRLACSFAHATGLREGVEEGPQAMYGLLHGAEG
jgi:hypothetical protein